jgi:hypothetical protein
MTERPEIWLVAREEELVAELVVEALDGPWVRGRVVAHDGFAPLRGVFDGEQHLGNREVRLIKPTGEDAGEFLLHVDGRRASWRHWAAPAWRTRLLILALIVISGFAAAPASALARRPIHHQKSNNWAGYAVEAAAGLKGVSGSWTEPRATCDQPFPTYSAFWVGLGGLTRASKAIEQIGTEADCSGGGHPKTFAWYEMFPAVPVKVRLAVHAGDQIAASVIARGGGEVTLRLRNLSTGRSFTRTVSMSSPDTSSADWIAEAPSACNGGGDCQALPLTDFGTIRFADARATTGTGHTGTIADAAFSATRLTLVAGGPPLGPPSSLAPGARVVPVAGNRATASGLSERGGAFTVTVQQASPR